jgi:Asp-tRNA(Asn)/Glu-tRNA(Gln) amidotransferase C subunit
MLKFPPIDRYYAACKLLENVCEELDDLAVKLAETARLAISKSNVYDSLTSLGDALVWISVGGAFDANSVDELYHPTFRVRPVRPARRARVLEYQARVDQWFQEYWKSHSEVLYDRNTVETLGWFKEYNIFQRVLEYEEFSRRLEAYKRWKDEDTVEAKAWSAFLQDGWQLVKAGETLLEDGSRELTSGGAVRRVVRRHGDPRLDD